MFQAFFDWLDNPREHRKLKSIVWCIPKFISTFGGITAFFAFFIGDFYSNAFPKKLFWIIASLLTILISIYYVRSARACKYADPFLKKCAINDYGATFYAFSNRNDLPDHTIVEIRKIKNGIATPYALAYIDQQDYLNKGLMIVSPFASYGTNGYFATQEFKFISRKSYNKYVVDYRPLKYDTMRSML